MVSERIATGTSQIVKMKENIMGMCISDAEQCLSNYFCSVNIVA